MNQPESAWPMAPSKITIITASPKNRIKGEPGALDTSI